MGTSEDRSLVLYTVVPDAGPTDESTATLVTAVRAAELDGVERIGVTGLTAINIDLSESLAEAIPVYLVPRGRCLSLIVLLVVFRVRGGAVGATAGFLLSMGATMGLVVTAFGNPNFTWLVGVDRAGPVLSFLPIMATGILYGLAMDYQVFLGTSIREAYVHGETARLAVVDGFHHASRVVVAAAIIMVSVFGGFVLSDDSMIRQFGFALAVGILIDAFVIRMALIPAVLHLAGDHLAAGVLDRILRGRRRGHASRGGRRGGRGRLTRGGARRGRGGTLNPWHPDYATRSAPPWRGGSPPPPSTRCASAGSAR